MFRYKSRMDSFANQGRKLVYFRGGERMRRTCSKAQQIDAPRSGCRILISPPNFCKIFLPLLLFTVFQLHCPKIDGSQTILQQFQILQLDLGGRT